MTPIEIMALIVVAFAAIKLLVVLINPQHWMCTVTKGSWTNPILTTLASLAVMVVSLIFLLQELTIVQIFAAMLFVMSFTMLGLAPYSKDVLELEEKMFKDGRYMLKKGWPATIVWVVLIIWTLYALFA
jgi:hypothetical protein